MADSVSIVIPTLNAARYLPSLLPAFADQSGITPQEVILVDSASDDQTTAIADDFPLARVVPIPRQAFTHGYARNIGVRHAVGDLVVFVSQDARPYDDHWLAELVAPFADAGVGGVYSRQIPYPDANPIETTFLQYWFPPEARRMRAAPDGADRQSIRFLDVFFSNVSSATRRALALQHPFHEQLIMSEDQQFARDLVHDGHQVAYAPLSRVWHSHTYTLKQVFQRGFDSAFSLTEIFGHTMGESVKTGKSYLPHELRTIATHHPFWLPYYALYVLTRGAAVFAGHHADRMPRRLARACSMHKTYWDAPRQRHQPDDAPGNPRTRP